MNYLKNNRTLSYSSISFCFYCTVFTAVQFAWLLLQDCNQGEYLIFHNCLHYGWCASFVFCNLNRTNLNSALFNFLPPPPTKSFRLCLRLKLEIDFTVCAGPEITDELVKVLRKRLDETTLDIITVMLVRNCKLTPADVEVRPVI